MILLMMFILLKLNGWWTKIIKESDSANVALDNLDEQLKIRSIAGTFFSVVSLLLGENGGVPLVY